MVLRWLSLLFYISSYCLCSSGAVFCAEVQQPSGSLNFKWEVDDKIQLPPSSLKILQLRYPSIHSKSDLSRLLVSIASKAPVSNLEAVLVGESYFITGMRATVVTKIDFDMAPLSMLPKLRAATVNWVGQVHTPELMEKVERDIAQFLRKRGYLEAKATIDIKNTGEEATYGVNIDIGSPCIIRGYQWDDAVPNIHFPKVDSGELCDAELVMNNIEAIERVFHDADYLDASLDFDQFVRSGNTSYAYIKVRGPFGQTFEYSFVDSISGQDASNQLSSSELQNLTPRYTAPDAIPFEITNALKSRGYIDAQVVGPEQIVRGNVASHRYTLNRGDQYVIASLKFEGNTALTSGDLVGLIKTDYISSTLRNDQAAAPYNPEAIAAGIESMKSKYVKMGFWDIKIEDRVTISASSGTKKVTVTVIIEEGIRNLFDGIEITGVKSIAEDDIKSHWLIESEQPFDRSDVINYQQKIRAELLQKGYYYASVQVDLVPSRRTKFENFLSLKVTIDEGSRVRFGDVFVTGLIKTQQKVVTRELLFETGDLYDPALLTESRRALLKLGSFSNIMMTPLDPVSVPGESDMIDILIEVKEAPSLTISFGPGWSSYYGMRYSVEGALTNLWGTGRQVFSKAAFNQEKSQNAIGDKTLVGRSIGVGYLEPHILDTNIDGTIRANQDALATDYAWSLTRGGELEFSHTLRYFLTGSKVSGFYGRKLNEEEGDTSAKDAFLADTFRVGRVGMRLNIDHRDDMTWPTGGTVLTSEVSWARYELGGDLRYFRWEIGNNYYVPLTERFVFAFGINVSAFQEVTRQNESDQDILPASERLNAGGTETVRGFGERSLGPIVRRPNIKEGTDWDCTFTNSKSGGSRRVLLKSELRYRWSEAVATTAFIDSGNTSFSSEEMAKFEKAFAASASSSNSRCPTDARVSIEDNVGYDFTELPRNPKILWDKNYSSTGAALNLLTPIGSINLAYGIPWHEPKSQKCKDDDSFCFSRIPEADAWWKKGEVHINVGAKF
jgi:outer membrane protein assembly complex protein YaeT